MKRTTHFTQNLPTVLLPVLLAFVLAAQTLRAQDLQMYYDLFTDSVTYKKDGKPVLQPKIRRGDFVVLHFTEFNPYLYVADVEIEQTNSEEWSGGASSGAAGAGAGGLMSGLIPGMSGSAAGGGGLSSFFNMPLLSMGQNSMRLADFFGNARGTQQLLTEAQTQLQALAQIQSEMAEIYSEIQTLERSERAAQLAGKHLDQLLQNPRIRPSMIRRIAAEYEEMIFPGKPVGSLQIADAFEWQDRPQAKRRLLAALSAKQQEFDIQLLNLTPIARQLSDLDTRSSPGLEAFATDLRTLTGKGDNLRQQLEAYIVAQTDTTKVLTLEEMLAIQMKFRELAEQTFSYPVAISVEKSRVIVNARFVPLDSVLTATRDKKLGTKTKTVKLETQGGLRISTSFGIAFGRMFDPTEDYSVRENAIVAEAGGIVQPGLATFVHFYPNNNRRGMSLAGSFGIGIPLSMTNLTGLNFYLGPSLLFGRGQRFVLSGGVLAGPATRLAKGFSVGDAFDPNLGDIPTRTRYELGYFVGISFNVGG